MSENKRKFETDIVINNEQEGQRPLTGQRVLCQNHLSQPFLVIILVLVPTFI